MKQLSAATAFYLWTAFTLVFIKLAEVLIFGKSVSWVDVVFMLLIMTGALGLRFFASNLS